MLLLTEPAPVPRLVVAGGPWPGDAPDYVRGRRHPQRALISFSDAWHAVGPALVLLTAGSPEIGVAQLERLLQTARPFVREQREQA